MKTEPSPRYDPADASIPRARVMKEFTGDPGHCPRCGGRLCQHYHSYLVATRRGKELADFFNIGGKFGWFCPDCPTVVLDTQQVEKILVGGAASRWDVGEEYIVIGLIDFDAVPEDKVDLPLGTDENPIPLVEFTDIRSDAPASSGRPHAAKRARAKRKRDKRRKKRSRKRR